MNAAALTAWLQFDLALRHDGAGPAANAHAALRAVGQALPHHPSFFQRKPPDVRLRIAVDPSGEDVDGAAATATATLRAEVDAARLAAVAAGTYEPETDRFGGDTAMATAHRHFCRDTGAWLAVAPSLRPVSVPGGGDPAPPSAAEARWWLSRWITHAAVPDPDDRPAVWEAWAVLAGEASGPDAPSFGRPAPLVLTDHGTVLAQSVARDLAAVPVADLAHWLALVHHFDANRWGVPGPEQARIAAHHLHHDTP